MRTCRAALLILFTTLRLSAQGLTAQVSGSIHDASGKLVAHARVVLENALTSQVRLTQTSEAGTFTFTEVLPGRFKLRIEADGFKVLEQAGVDVSASERLALAPIALEVGGVKETVRVNAATEQLQTQSAERSGLIDSEQLQELSLKGRDYLATAKLLPGVLDINAATREAPGAATLQGIFINGNRQGSLNLTLDGISTMDTGGGTGPYFEASVDAVAEVQILLTNYQAEYGRSSGGTINTITRSGSKEFHGGLYYYLRNEDLNANEFFNNRQGIPRPQYRFNYPGYFVGGPVLIPGTNFNRHRNKLFFFWSEEFLPRTYPTSVTFQTFPTALERQGNFSKSFDQNGQLIVIRDPLTAAPFAGNIVPANRISLPGQALLNVFPSPNAVSPTGAYNYVFQSSIEQPRNDQIARIDYSFSPNTQFYARGILDHQTIKGGFGFNLASPSWPQMPIDYQANGKGVVGTLIHSFTPSRINEFTFGLNHGIQAVAPLNEASLAANSRAALHLNLPQFYPQANPSNLIPNATFGGVPNAPQLTIDQRYPFLGNNDVWEYSDNYAQVSGAHNLKFGVYIDRSDKSIQLATSFNGTFAFDRDPNNPLDTGYAFSNAILGSFDSYTESSGHPAIQARDTNVEWYGQDSWRVGKRLTIDAGLRFYLIHPTSSPGTKLASFDPALYNAALQPPLIQPYIDPSTRVREGRDPVTGQILPAVKIGSFSTAAGTPNQAMKIFTGSPLRNPPIQLAPRFGVAWDVSGTGRTAVRGGFGIFYDRFPQNQMGQLLIEPPLVNTPAANYSTVANLLSTPLSLSPNVVFGIQGNYKPPTVYNWSFGIQQSIGFGSMLDVAYVGDVSRHGMQIRNLNATPYGTNFLASSIDSTQSGNKPLPPNFLRPYPGYSDIELMEMASNSNYHALQVQLRKRLSSRVTFHLSYTWSKVLDVADTVTSAVNPYLDYNRRNYGPASFDRRQNVAINYVYNVPSLARYWSGGTLSREVFDGWELSGIASFISGPPMALNYTFVTATDITGASGIGIDSRVDLTCNPNLSTGDKTFYRAFNTSCVAAPTKAGLGIGNASKYPITGPGVENVDISLFKNFRLGSESRRLQVRLETYNTFNHAQFTTLDNNARFDATGKQVNQQFGQYTATAPGRRLVLGAKIYF